MIFFLCKFGFGKCFGASQSTELVITGCHIKSTFRCTSQSNEEMVCYCIEEEKKTPQKDSSLNLFMRDPFIELFHLSNLLQMPSDLEQLTFFSSVSCSFRGSALVIALSWWSASGGRPLCLLARASSPLQNCLNHHYSTLAFPGPDVLLMLRVVSTAL